MNLVPLYKSEVIDYGMLELMLKLWNLSKNMRKRLQRLLKGRVIVLLEYDCRLTVFGCWIRTLNETNNLTRKRKPLERLCDYTVSYEKDVQAIQEVNGSLGCRLDLSQTISPVTFELVYELDIDSYNFGKYRNLTFIRVYKLVIDNLTSTQIQQILSRITYLDSIKIKNSTLSGLNLALTHTKALELRSVTIKANLKLPSVLESITLKECKGINLLKFNKIRRFYCEPNTIHSRKKVKYHFFKAIKSKVKDSTIEHIAINFPSSVRYIKGLDINKENIPQIKARLPYLIGLEDETPFETAQELKLRITSTKGLNEFKDEITLRPRKAVITKEEEYQIKKFKALFEKTTQFDIRTSKFDFRLIPAREKQVTLDLGYIKNYPDYYYDMYDSDPNGYCDQCDDQRTEIEVDSLLNETVNLEKNLWKFKDQTLVIKCRFESTNLDKADPGSISFTSFCSFGEVRLLKFIRGEFIHYFRYGDETGVDIKRPKFAKECSFRVL